MRLKVAAKFDNCNSKVSKCQNSRELLRRP